MRKITTLLIASIIAVGLYCDLSKENTYTDGNEKDTPTVIDYSGMTYAEFKASIYKEPGENGVWIVDWDIPIENEKKLKEYYNSRIAKLIVDVSGQSDNIWSDSNKNNITYCISDNFGSYYNETVTAMNNATGAWEAEGDVTFVHVSSQDGNCTASNNSVLFDVNPTTTTQYYARAFFPDSSRSARNVLISTTIAYDSNKPSITGILRHELGHALGLRHEHTRPEAGTCYEDSNWRALTSYDSGSVMHYPQCNGSGDWSLVLTNQDKAGFAILYPEGGTPPPPDPVDGTIVNEVFNDSVRKRGKDTYSFDVVGGSDFLAKLTGDGDADLYVNFDATASTSSYVCRPYLTGTNETCDLTVPSYATSASILVYGYATSNYNLDVTYTTPSGTEPPPDPDPEPDPEPEPDPGTCGVAKTACTSDADCCSNNCFLKKGTCR